MTQLEKNPGYSSANTLTLLCCLSLIFLFGLILVFLPTVVDASTIVRAPNNFGLVGYWPMNEGRGNVAGDHSGGGNHGTLEGDPSWTTGKIGGALEFDGVDDTTDHGDSLDFERTDSFSVSAWIRPDNPESQDSIISKMLSSDTYRGWGFWYLDDEDKLRFLLRHDWNGGDDPNMISVESNVGDLSGNIAHVTMTYSGSSNASGVRIFLDGSEVTDYFVKDDNLSGTTLTSAPLTTGSRNKDSKFFDGAIDDVRIYNRALSENEVKNLYERSARTVIGASPRNRFTDGLVGYWTFDGRDMDWGTSSGQVRDVSDEGNHGTLEGGMDQHSAAIGRVGQGLEFDGSSDYIDVSGDLIFSGNFTVTAWIYIKEDPVSERGWVVRGGTPGGDSTSQILSGFGYIPSPPRSTFHARDEDLDYRGVTSDDELPTNDWIFVAGKRDEGTVFVWEPISKGWKSGGYDDATITVDFERLHIGYDSRDNPDTNEAFNGKIDDVRIYDRALSAEEINALYTATKPSVIRASEQVTEPTFSCGDNFTDERDGTTYATVEIGNRCWLAENLKYLPEVHSNSEFDTKDNNNEPGYGVYGYDGSDVATAKAQSNYDTYGVLYNWWAVMEGAADCNGTGTSPDDACSEPVQGACPDGWYVPSHYEITTLERYLCAEAGHGNCETEFPYDESTIGYQGTDEGSALAGEAVLWDSGDLKSHARFGESGFEARPAGYRWTSGSFDFGGSHALFWSSSVSDGSAWRRTLNRDYSSVDRYTSSRGYGFSLRCLRDD